MEFTIQMLVDFGLDADIGNRFTQENVTQCYFEYLSETDQRELMPKMIDRLKFRKGLAEFKKERQELGANHLDKPCKSNDENIVNIFKY